VPQQVPELEIEVSPLPLASLPPPLEEYDGVTSAIEVPLAEPDLPAPRDSEQSETQADLEFIRHRDLKQLEPTKKQSNPRSRRRLLLLNDLDEDGSDQHLIDERPTVVKTLEDLWNKYLPSPIPVPSEGLITPEKKAWYEQAKTQAMEEARQAYLAAATRHFQEIPPPAFFPWEHPPPPAEISASAPNHTIPMTGRRLLMDAFGDSLRHVNSLLNKEFGNEARKVPLPSHPLLLLPTCCIMIQNGPACSRR